MQDSTAEFDQTEQEILSSLQPEGVIPGTPPGDPMDAPEAQPATPAAAQATGEQPAQPAQEAQPEQSQAQPPAATSEAAPPAEPEKPQGDTRAALRAARRAEQRAREQARDLDERNKRLAEELAQLRKQSSDGADLTDEQVAQVEALGDDVPAAAQLVQAFRRANARIAELEARAGANVPAPVPEFVPPVLPPEVQEVVDDVPALSAWQHDHDQTRFQAAVRVDALLQTLPGWKDKPFAQRAAEIVRRVEADLAPAQASAPAPTPERRDPAKVIDSVPTAQPSTIADLRGGLPPNAATPDYSRMTDEEIMASLPSG